MKAKEKKQPIDWLLLGQLLVVILVLLTYLALEASSTRSHTGWFRSKQPPSQVSFTYEVKLAGVWQTFRFCTTDPAAMGEFIGLLNSCDLARETWYTAPIRAIALPDTHSLPGRDCLLRVMIDHPGQKPDYAQFQGYMKVEVAPELGRDTRVYFAPVWKSTQVEAAFWESFASFAASAMADPRWQVEKPVATSPRLPLLLAVAACPVV